MVGEELEEGYASGVAGAVRGKCSVASALFVELLVAEAELFVEVGDLVVAEFGLPVVEAVVELAVVVRPGLR